MKQSAPKILSFVLAPGALAHHDRAAMVLEAGRNDLAGAGAVSIDQHDHIEALERAPFLRVPDALFHRAPLGADDAALGDEHIAHLDRRTEQPAGGVGGGWRSSRNESQEAN